MLAIRRTLFNGARRRSGRIMRCCRRFLLVHRSTLKLLLLTSLGVVVGFSVTMCLQILDALPISSAETGCLGALGPSLSTRRMVKRYSDDADQSRIVPTNVHTAAPGAKNGFIYIGVMTAKKFLPTRATTIIQTWGQTISSTDQLAMFVGDNVDSDSYLDLPLVRLPRVDDSYPPQKKSFLMLKYMYDNYLDNFEWFIRADDDVYLRMDKLEVFLRSLNSSQPLFVGQAGLGTPEEYGMLSLGDDENYCMGGPGIVMSRETLRLIGPHIKECLKTLYTSHEDVELGRCVKRFAGVSCTWSYEMQSIFYNNQSGPNAYSGDLNVAEVHHAVTLHPIKQPVLMKRVHNFVRRMKISDLRFRSIQLSRDVLTSLKELDGMGFIQPKEELAQVQNLALSPSLTKFVPKNRDHILVWDYLTPTVVYCSNSVNCPRHNAESYLRYAIQDVIRQTMDTMNKYARQRGRVLVFQDILYGYRRIDPLHGAEYVLDILLMYKKFKGRRVSIPVRRHAYIQQTFGQLQMIDENDLHNLYFSDSVAGRFDVSLPSNDVINFILPLSGRSTTFRRFLNNFNELNPQSSGLRLIVVLFPSSDPLEDEANLNILTEYYLTNPAVLNWTRLDVPFSRGLALTKGSSVVTDESLMFFTDVDMAFTFRLLYHIRTNTVRSKQVYFPIVYSEYDPRFTTSGSSRTNYVTAAKSYDLHRYGTTEGYFRHFGYGLVSLYKSDFEFVGGFDLTLKGWGMEDVDLFDKFLKRTNLTLIRAPEPDLVHVYHPMECSKQQLNRTQYDMCLGSKGASMASVHNLVDILSSDQNLFQEFFSSSTNNVSFNNNNIKIDGA